MCINKLLCHNVATPGLFCVFLRFTSLSSPHKESHNQHNNLNFMLICDFSINRNRAINQPASTCGVEIKLKFKDLGDVSCRKTLSFLSYRRP